MGNLDDARALVREIADNNLAFYSDLIEFKVTIPYFFVTFFAFAVAYVGIDWLLLRQKAEFYMSRNHYKQVKWRAELLAMISHCIFPFWVLALIFNACPEKGTYGWFTDME